MDGVHDLDLVLSEDISIALVRLFVYAQVCVCVCVCVCVRERERKREREREVWIQKSVFSLHHVPCSQLRERTHGIRLVGKHPYSLNWPTSP